MVGSQRYYTCPDQKKNRTSKKGNGESESVFQKKITSKEPEEIIAIENCKHRKTNMEDRLTRMENEIQSKNVTLQLDNTY